MKKRRQIDFRNDTRDSGIPRNYFIYNGSVVNAAASPAELKKVITQRPDPRPVELYNSPDRASTLIFSEHIHRKMTPQISQDPSFRKFVVEGPRISDGSYVETIEEKAVNRSRRLLLPSYNKDMMVHKLQR